MRSNYKKLGEYIELVPHRNSELLYGESDVRGVSNNKEIIQTKANNKDRAFNNFYVVASNDFIYNSRTSRMGDKVGLGFNNTGKPFITSFNNTVFRVKNEALLPMYLYMWFNRPEFDRYARFHSWGSSTELFSWDDMCNVELPVPSIEKQRAIVKEYNTIVNRINLNEQLNQKLEETAQTLYKHWFVDFEFPNGDGKPYKSSGGKMLFNAELDKEIPEGWEVEELKNRCKVKGGKRLPKGESLIKQKTQHPYIKIADMTSNKYLVHESSFEYVEEEVQKKISRYIVAVDDVIISIVGATIGIINIIYNSLSKANLTENCVKLTNLSRVTPDFLYHFFYSEYARREIEMRIVGGAQGKLPIYNIEAVRILFPSDSLLQSFSKVLAPLNQQLKTRVSENSILMESRDIILSKMTKVETEKEIS